MGINILDMGTHSAAIRPDTEPMDSGIASRQSLAGALFTATQQRLLGLLFGQTGRSYFVTELIELARVGRGTVQRELSRLERSGLVLTERYGNQKHYRANPDSPIFEELRAIVSKTVGVRERVRAALEQLDSRISLALIYGSLAKGSDTANSDIDVLIVSDDLTLEDVFSCVSGVESHLGRRINPTLYTTREFNNRRDNGSAFLNRVLEGPTVSLKGKLNVQ